MTVRRRPGQKQKKHKNIFMTKPGDLLTKKTIHELAKEFPEKTYRELEKYRDADRQEEAQRIITQRENEELKENQFKETWKDKYELEHRLRQEAETETILVKGIGMNSPEMKAAKEKIKELQSNLDRIKKENNDLYNRIAKLSDPVQKARESGM
jgi:GTP-dependent phosphoenolpyruvate carboxykinase